MMAFKGVRISWLILARKLALAKLAETASSFAACNASLAACCRLTSSRNESNIPFIGPSLSLKYVAFIRTQRQEPSLRAIWTSNEADPPSETCP